MKTLAGILVPAVLAGTLLVPAPGRPDEAAPGAGQAEPQAAQPALPPPAPPSEAPPAPPAQAQPASPAVPVGQWVYTSQYGWVWMPYGAAYNYIPPDGYGAPYVYVYYPTFGWTWLVAPWIWGWGPWPYFGVYGPWRFAWYGYGYWRYPWRWSYTGGGYRPTLPAPYRAGVGARPGAVYRTAPMTHGGAMGGGARVGIGHRR